MTSRGKRSTRLRINRVSAPTILLSTITIKIRHGNHTIMTISTKLNNIRLRPTSIHRSTNRRRLIIMKLNRGIITTRLRHPSRHINVVRAKHGSSKTIVPTPRPLTRIRTINIQRGSIRRSSVRILTNVTRHLTTNLHASRFVVLLTIRGMANHIPSRKVILRRGRASRSYLLSPFSGGFTVLKLMCLVLQTFSAIFQGFHSFKRIGRRGRASSRYARHNNTNAKRHTNQRLMRHPTSTTKAERHHRQAKFQDPISKVNQNVPKQELQYTRRPRSLTISNRRNLLRANNSHTNATPLRTTTKT